MTGAACKIRSTRLASPANSSSIWNEGGVATGQALQRCTGRVMGLGLWSETGILSQFHYSEEAPGDAR